MYGVYWRAMAGQERRRTSIQLDASTVEELKSLKQKGFGAEESFDHLIRRLVGLPELDPPEGVPA
jgi:hypothetical protein